MRKEPELDPMARMVSLRIFVLVAAALPPLPLQAQPAREELQQLAAQVLKTPNDEALRERVIKLALTLKPAPALPVDAERRMARGAAAFAGATSAADYREAAKEFEQATLVAPWYGDAYFNLGVAQDKAGDLDGALRSLKLAQIALPGSKDVSTLFYQVEYRKEKANSPAAQAARKKETDEAFIRSLDGVRFECPELRSSEQRQEHWLQIRAHQVAVWTRVIWADRDLVRANPKAYSPGATTNARIVPIVGTVARHGGPNWEVSYRIGPSQVVIDWQRDGQAEPSVICRRL